LNKSFSKTNQCILDSNQVRSLLRCLEISIVNELVQGNVFQTEVIIKLFVSICGCTDCNICRISIGKSKNVLSIRLSSTLDNCDVLIGHWRIYTDTRSDFFSLLLVYFCFTLLGCNLCLNKRLFSLWLQLDINDLKVWTVGKHLIKFLINCFSQDFTSCISLFPEHGRIKLTNLCSDSIIYLRHKCGQICFLILVIKMTNVILLKSILNWELKGDGLTIAVFNFHWLTLSIWIVSEINIDKSWWENDEALDWSDEIPASWINLSSIDFLSKWVIDNSIFNWLNCSNTDKNYDKDCKKTAYTASDSTKYFIWHI